MQCNAMQYNAMQNYRASRKFSLFFYCFVEYIYNCFGFIKKLKLINKINIKF